MKVAAAVHTDDAVEDLTVFKDQLNQSQHKFVKLTSKYLSLFVIAMLSSIVTWVLVGVFYYIGGIFMGLDVCVNIVCLYLQHSSAQKHYAKHCSRLDVCCIRQIERKMMRRRATIN